MTGIPSIGDILMLSQLAWKVGRAFTAGRKGAPPEFLAVESEVNRLAKALKLLAETMFADTDDSLLDRADRNTRHGVNTIIAACQRTVNDLDSLMDQYQVIKKNRTAGGFAIERSWSNLVLTQYKSMMWTTEGGNIQSLRNKLHMHTTTITLTTQALQSKSLSQLESVVNPMALKIDNIQCNPGSLNEQLEEVHRVVIDIAGRTPQLPVGGDMSRPPSSLTLNNPQSTGPIPESFSARECFLPQQSSRSIPLPSPSIDMSVTAVPSSPTATATSLSPTTSPTMSPNSRKRISEFSFGGTTNRYSGSYASSDVGGGNSGWPGPTPNRNSYLGRSLSQRQNHLLGTPEEPRSRPDSTVLPPLPPPAMDIPPDPEIDRVMPMAKLTVHPPAQSETAKFHRSSASASQRSSFEKQAFRNSAILCDVRGVLVEYTQKVSPENEELEMVQACEGCRIAIVRKREPWPDKTVHMITSIWVFSDDNTVRMELRLEDGEMYVPYSSYFSPEKISVTVPCELKYHDVKFGSRPIHTERTHWINYVFEDVKGATLFQNEIMGRTLLGTFRTEKTLRIHEGISGAFSYQEQMCGMENLRIWEDDTTSAIVALIHFSAHFRKGYLAFYLNSSNNPIRVKDEGGKEIKIKGLRVSLEKSAAALRKDSVAGVPAESGESHAEKMKKGGKDGKEIDRKKIISGARIEFASEAEKWEFIALVKNVQKDMKQLPDLLGVN